MLRRHKCTTTRRAVACAPSIPLERKVATRVWLPAVWGSAVVIHARPPSRGRPSVGPPADLPVGVNQPAQEQLATSLTAMRSPHPRDLRQYPRSRSRVLDAPTRNLPHEHTHAYVYSMSMICTLYILFIIYA